MSEMSNLRDVRRHPRERIIGLIRDILGPALAPRLLPIDARLNELGLSSIKMINLMLAIEAQFDLSIPQSEITPVNFDSIATIEALVARLSGPDGC